MKKNPMNKYLYEEKSDLVKDIISFVSSFDDDKLDDEQKELKDRILNANFNLVEK
jgi:hypothetical protein